MLIFAGGGASNEWSCLRRLALMSAVCIQESRAVAGKPHDAVVKFDTYQNSQRHRAVLPAIVRISCNKK